MSREYRFLDEPGATSAVEKYVNLPGIESADAVRDTWDWEDRWYDFEHSPEFRSLSTGEQTLSRYTIKRVVEDEAPWSILGKGTEDTLVDSPAPLYTIPSTIDDAMILSGLRGWELTEELVDSHHKNKRVLGHLALGDYVDLTMAAMLYGRRSSSDDYGLSYFVPGQDITTRYMIGGTFHGDFIAGWKQFVTRGSILDPMGIGRNFAPAITGEFVRAYHSVEDAIAIAMLKYLAAGDESRLEDAKSKILDAMVDAYAGRGGGNFADFGEGNRSYLSAIYAGTFHEYEPGEVLESFIIDPDDQENQMQIVATDDGVVLRNVVMGEKGILEEGQSMAIASRDIPTFIGTMSGASAGRTSAEKIYSVIAKAHLQEL